MKLQQNPRPHYQERPYSCPVAVVISFETEETLAKSNTEQIIEDDGEYGWN
jgi:hypothetical protein